MPLRFTGRILAHLADARYVGVNQAELADQLGVDTFEQSEFETAVAGLMSDGSISRGGDGRLQLPPMGDEIVGRIRVHPKGFAFLIPDQPNREGDLFIPLGEYADAISGDRVRAKVKRALARGRRGGGKARSAHVGRVIEIIEREKSSFCGTLLRRDGQWVVETDGRDMFQPVLVRDVGAKNAIAGDKVIVRILEYPSSDYGAVGVITQRLGPAGRPDVETQAVIHTYNLPGPFPAECVDQAGRVSTGFQAESLSDEVAVREDLRRLFTITIDPPDARDFDDAVSIQRLPDGGFELGIHIADVSYFVTADSALDREARSRGNSVYLPRHVIPMLPEVLSNGVCSLQEGVDRLTKTVFIRYEATGKVRRTQFRSSVIRSDKRLAYLEAEALIKGDRAQAAEHAGGATEYSEQLVEALCLMSELADAIRARRLRDGMIVLTLPEVELIFDKRGRVIGARPEDEASTHGLIEMFMVEANEAVAHLFERLHVPVLRRTHPDPSTFDLGELRQFCRVAGLNIPRNPTRFELQRILDLTRGTPRQQAVHLAILKTMTRAEYSPAMIGHFALASNHYAHFTSPIRRYPDLLAHRALSAYLEATDNGTKKSRSRSDRELGRKLRSDDRCLDELTLLEVGRECNRTERNAALAESSLRSFLVLQYLKEYHLGDEFDAVVRHVTARVIWLTLQRFLVDGMAKVDDLESSPPATSVPKRRHVQRWLVNRNTGALVASQSGATINVGDRLNVRIVRVDPPSRQLDLLIRLHEASRRNADHAAHPRERQAGTRSRSRKRRLKQGRAK